MPAITPNMGLTSWDLTSDPYDHTQLAANFAAIDSHNHTAGKGAQIPTGGIQDGAITNSKLATNAVSTVKVQDGAITSIKMDREYVHPLGEFMWWWRPNSSTDVPGGWVVCRGQVLTAAEHDFAGGGAITVPNVINAFILGADMSGTGNTPSEPPAIGAAGGAHTRAFAHSHSVPAHYHGKGNLNIPIGGFHGHNLYTVESDEGTGFPGHAAVHSITYDQVYSMIQGMFHTHGTEEFAGNVGNTSGANGDGDITTSNGLTGVSDIRPGFVGFLPLLKVKH